MLAARLITGARIRAKRPPSAPHLRSLSTTVGRDHYPGPLLCLVGGNLVPHKAVLTPYGKLGFTRPTPPLTLNIQVHVPVLLRKSTAVS
jgi:hypothetical protein